VEDLESGIIGTQIGKDKFFKKFNVKKIIFSRIIKGLLACEMYQTTRGIIENFLSVVDKHGFIPNGGRVYYNKRSHPPLLSGTYEKMFSIS
jgi:hypothetical protein